MVESLDGCYYCIEFNITIVDRPGKENLIADFLSRIHNESENGLVDDSFPDEHLFSISTNSPWFADIENYLATRKLSTPFFMEKTTNCQAQCQLFMDQR
jgi:hypothetical protein